MSKYRKKPVEIEAFQLLIDNMPKWFMDELADGNASIGQEGRKPETVCRIKTLEGTMIAKPGDYIIKGVQGEFYPCKPDIFEQTYEPVTDYRQLTEVWGSTPSLYTKDI